MTETTPLTIRLSAEDNVVVARSAIAAGTEIPGEGVTATDAIPAGHKIATAPIGSGDAVRKYDQIIGFASGDIVPGNHVHTHNCAFAAFERDYAYGVDARPTSYLPESQRATFQGILRADGRVATRNYIGVLTTVNCSATVGKAIARAFEGDALADYPGVDGVVAFTHGFGCCMATDGDGFAILQRLMWGYARHANLAGVLMVGLGCEANQISFLLDAYGLAEGPTFRVMNIQETGGTRSTIEAGVKIIREMLPAANAVERQTVPASHLTVALQCGGSDGYSGITANPALGAASDILVRNGGTVVLAETPEIYGAEHLLTRRAASRAVGEKLIERIRWWEDYAARNGGSMDNNPTPGNKAGGLTTILEKSLGAAAKGGTTNLAGVYEYAEPVTEKGFVFMDSPGYDPASITGQVASGANLVCFTTGRGSAFGFKPAPSIKLATNTPMYERLEEDMDINCGEILDRGVSVQAMGERIFRMFLEVASGTPSKSEALGLGDNEFVPWLVGAVM
ncbi:MAG: altronate dehydratase [Rhodospirillales bacterium]|nr:MAG: altronate dehydratase [Rhodospirillales bacterium]